VPIGHTWLEHVSTAEAAGLHCPDADHAVANFVSDSSPDGPDRQRLLLAASRRMEQLHPVWVQYVLLHQLGEGHAPVLPIFMQYR